MKTILSSPCGGDAPQKRRGRRLQAVEIDIGRTRPVADVPASLRSAPPHFSATVSPKMLTPLGEDSERRVSYANALPGEGVESDRRCLPSGRRQSPKINPRLLNNPA